jgi:hypothetical protein
MSLRKRERVLDRDTLVAMRATPWIWVVAALLAGCAGKSEKAPTSDEPGGAKLSACDPLAEVTSSVTLQASRVVAAGRASDGTLYVIYNSTRLFVGSDDQLVER